MGLHQLLLDSFTQRTESAYVSDNPMNWNLSKPFMFWMTDDGLVTLVKYSREDEYEVVALKKVLASVLSAKRKIHGKKSKFTHAETDHSGHLVHDYEVERTKYGSKVTRKHQSNHDAERSHNKTLHYNHEGTITLVSTADRVTLKEKQEEKNRTYFLGEVKIEDATSGDPPSPTTISTSLMKLQGKKVITTKLPTDNPTIEDSILIVPKPPEKKRFVKENNTIITLLACIDSHKDKFATNRTECVVQLRQILTNLDDTDFQHLARRQLEMNCNPNNTFCRDRRNLFIDMTARRSDNISQELIITYVLHNKISVEEDIQRFLFHCPGIANPSHNLVEAVKHLCLGEDDKLLGAALLSKTQRRACLALGSLIKNIKGLNASLAEETTSKIEQWLNYHNETRSSAILKPRKRRDVTEFDANRHHHIVTKMVLIHVLGNAGMERSVGHIISYMQPGKGAVTWRRSAARGLRHFSCYKSAEALLTTAIHDKSDIVRKIAIEAFKQHSKGKQNTREYQNILLGRNYSYPVVMRMKRGIDYVIDEDGLRFLLELPGINWHKDVGTSDIGASIGLEMRNKLELELAPLSGYFEVDVYDTAYAEVHIGYINLHQDIFRALACYGGNIRYDFNILKDFGINKLSDLANAFDRIFSSIVDPIIKAIKAFKQIIEFFKNGGIALLIDTITNVVKNLPTIFETVATKMFSLVMKLLDLAGKPWLEKAKYHVTKIKNAIEDMKTSVMQTYNSVVDAVTITMPYIGKKLINSVTLLFSSLKSVLQNPAQSFKGFGKAIQQIRMAVLMFIDTKNQITDGLSSSNGQIPSWMNAGDDILGLFYDLKNLVVEFQNNTDSSTKLSDGIATKVDCNTVKEELMNIIKESIFLVVNVSEIAKPFQDAFKSVTDVIKSVKHAYEQVKKVINKGKSILQKVFGPKFNLKFPNRRRRKIEPCGQGIWPTTSGDTFDTTGVDLLISKGKDVPCPLNGMVRDRGENTILVKPADEDLKELEIVIQNVIPNSNVTRGWTFINTGANIGRAAKSRCSPNFIHVAIRKVASSELDDKDYEYLDPSPYLDRLIPIPKWEETCNDFSFEHLFQIVEADALDKQGAKESKKEISRSNKEKQKELSEMDIMKESSIYRPPGMDTNSSKTIGEQFKKGLKNAFAAFGDIGKFFTQSLKIPNILALFDINAMNLNRVRQILQTSHQITMVEKFDELVLKLQEMMLVVPTVNLQSLSVTELSYALSVSGIDARASKSSMVSQILSMATKLCPDLTDALANGFGHICIPHSDCLGLTCGLNLPFGMTEKKFKVDIRVDSCNGKLLIKSFETTAISLDGLEHSVDIGIDELCGCTPSAKLIVKGETASNSVRLWIGATVCVDEFMSCLPVIDVLKEVVFTNVIDCSKDANPADRLQNIYDMKFETFLSLLSEFNLLNAEKLQLFNNIRDAVLNLVFDEPQEFLKIVGQEFKENLDVCVDVRSPFPPIDISFLKYAPPIYFMIGPIAMSFTYGAGGAVGLQMDLGICFVSMKAKMQLTPWVGGKAWGAVAISFFIIRAGLKLVGYILQTQFATIATLKFDKFPVDIRAKLDLVLIPLSLELRAFLQLSLWFLFGRIRITLIDVAIWRYRAPAINQNIFEIPFKEDDKSPPEIMPTSVNKRKKREGLRGCLLKQIVSGNVVDPKFMLEVSFEDEMSDVVLHYAIGTQEGGTNVIDWTEMGGKLLVVPTNLPNGIPLYWTVRAKNSQGLAVYTHCMLQTYDNTVPDGRVDPSYKYSSHPHTLSGTIFVFDDSPIDEQNEKALGYSAGQASEVVYWDAFTTAETTHRSDIDTNLKYFSVPKPGRLTSFPFITLKVETDISCATECLKYRAKCVAFDFEYHSETCDLQAFVEGPSSYRRISGTYKTYERLGIGHTSYIEYRNIHLVHGEKYHINAKITNKMNYTSYLHSEGTIVDFTPPFPGPLGKDYIEEIRVDKCNASKLQRCVDTTWLGNHRHIIDGKNGRTVFNGLQPLVDQKYTLVNHYASVNFDGFHDNETGIWAYMWALGTTLCGTDVVSFRDPHTHLTSTRYWSHTGWVKHLSLKDGPYFAVVQTLNNVIFGGSLVCTVCHSTPIIVDRSPPTYIKVTDFMYDEDFDLMGVYYNASDPQSGLSSVDFGLGKTKHDVMVRGYSLHRPMERENPYIVIEDLGLSPGVPAWIRLRAVNNVDLFTTNHYDEPILIDRTDPVAGDVLDGYGSGTDLTYQSDSSTICAEWKNFHDPESGISQFLWSVGTFNKTDDIVPFQKLSYHDRHACVDVTLKHNVTYYSTVIAYNNALSIKEVNITSNGVLIDITPPVAGWVHDGIQPKYDLEYSSHSAAKSCNWNNFTDPESKISKYEIAVYINNNFTKRFEINNGESTSFSDNSISLKHSDFVYFSLKAFDGADLTVDRKSNGFLIDQTTPLLRYIRDSETGSRFQTFDNKLNFWWEFEDLESSIKEYRYFVSKYHHGTRIRIWPIASDYISISPNTSLELKIAIVVDEFKLTNGAEYAVHVTAVNNALLTTSHQSDGVTIDITAPVLSKVHIGFPNEDEEQDEDGNILHIDNKGITTSWKGFDPESGITNFYACIGLNPGNCSLTNGFLDFGTKTTAYIKGEQLETFDSSNILYYVNVKARNGAGKFTETISSNAIKVLKTNIPGRIYDGPIKHLDKEFTTDRSSLSMSFQGFKSDSCNIVNYEWCIGSNPYYSDIIPYTNYGVTETNDGNGKGSVHLHLQENKNYHITVRAKTGHKCHEEYIVSSSDGIQLDITPPNAQYIRQNLTESSSVTKNLIQFQQSTDTIETEWILSENSVNVSWALGSYPGHEDIIPYTQTEENKVPPGSYFLSPGYSYFVSLRLQDSIGHTAQISSLPMIPDITAPLVHTYSCTNFISKIRSILFCRWYFIEELESMIKQVQLGIRMSDSDSAPIHNLTTLPLFASSWEFDLKQILQNVELNQLEITLYVQNILGQQQSFTSFSSVDKTPPKCDSVEIITRTDDKNYKINQVCQLPQTYIEIGIQNMVDEESGIKSLEIALGTSPYTVDIQPFKSVDVSEKIFIGTLSLRVGSSVYAVVKIFNNVGLYSVYRSKAVIISPLPRLKVLDGATSSDADYQATLNVMTGSWSYSDPCPVIRLEWKIEDITGKVIQNFTQIPGNVEKFYNDELELHNGVEYINFIRIVDALNRTKVAKSDGITVLIQRPSPGNVRDGLDSKDINYQLSTNTLSANWDNFGDIHSANPTETIVRYDIAIGSDRRYEKTRSNIYYFLNIGLRTSYAFSNLNLIPKKAKYYVTVRAYSEVGTYVEETSNGIRVGYKDGIGTGVIETKKFQSSTSQIDISWSGFESDIGIDNYKVGISSFSHEQNISNNTFDCKLLKNIIGETDIFPLQTINTDTYMEVDNLTLKQGHAYYAVVIASDLANLCSLQMSSPILIDTTSPYVDNATVILNGDRGRNLIYLPSKNILHVEWINIIDLESQISNTIIILYHMINSCPDNSKADRDNEYHTLRSIKVLDDTKVTFYDLNLLPNAFYFVRLIVTNNAGLESIVESPMFMIDTSPPLVGAVTIGSSWYKKSMFQFSSAEIKAWTAIARTTESYICSNQHSVLPNKIGSKDFKWSQIDGEDYDEIIVGSSEFILNIGYNEPLSKVLRSGVISTRFSLLEGNYTFDLEAASGKNIITTIAFGTAPNVVLSKFELPASDISYKSAFSNENKSSSANQTSTANSSVGFKHDKEGVCCGYGVSIVGNKEKESDKWACLFWAVDMYRETKSWVYTAIDPSLVTSNYMFSLSKDTTSSDNRWNVNLFINGKQMSGIIGLRFDPNMHLSIRTWNKDYYEEPIQDPFNPFRSKATIKNILIPVDYDKPCLHGKGFFDADSSIKEIWVGVSDNIEEMDNVNSMQLYEEFCIPCKKECQIGCNSSCLHSNKSFEILPIHLVNISLKSTIFKERNESLVAEMENATTYYVNVKVLDLAHHEVYARSNGIMIDVTPPECEYVRCIDPKVSKEQPTSFIGSNDTVGAYWSCTEDVSEISKYQFSVGSQPGIDDISVWADLGIENRNEITLENNTYFHHLKTYFINVKVFNSVGQSANYSCNVSAELIPPNVTGTVTEMLYGNDNNALKTITLLNIRFSEIFDRIGITWESANEDFQFYEWKIGTYPDGDDLFPKAKVGMQKSGKAEIKEGHLCLDDINSNISISAYKSRNMSEENITAIINADTLFLIERGRCLHETLLAVSRSHLSSSIKSDPICFKKPEDVIVSFENKSGFHLTKGIDDNGFKISEEEKSNDTLQIKFTAQSGGISIGILSDDDLQKTYGSAASSSYKPYIANPDYTKDKTSRIMKHRLSAHLGISFFIAPLTTVSMTTIEVRVFIEKDLLDDWSVPVLVRWDADGGKWIHVEEGCTSNFSQISKDGYYTVAICLNGLNEVENKRKRRQTQEPVTVSNPMQLSIFKMNVTTTNTAPVITTERFITKEDVVMVQSIDWWDNEGDKVTFHIEQTDIGMAQISNDGILSFTPPINFFGSVRIFLVATEVDLPYQVTPKITRKVITIDVEDINDPPVLFFIFSNKTVITADTTEQLQILLDGNSTSHILGTVVIADVDKFENLSILHKSFIDTAHVLIDEIPLNSLHSDNLYFDNFNSIRTFNINITVPVQIHGLLQFSFLGHDERSNGIKLYSPRLDIKLYVLFAPCIHGNCTTMSSSLSCDDVVRAETFDPYFCTCNKGYTSTWCETEINECLEHACSAIHDCIDGIGYYNCKINIGKLLGIIIGLVGATCVCVAGIITYKQMKKKQNKISDSSLLRGQQINRECNYAVDNMNDGYSDTDEEDIPWLVKGTVFKDDALPSTSEMHVRPAWEKSTKIDYDCTFDGYFDNRFPKPGTLPRPGTIETKSKHVGEERRNSIKSRIHIEITDENSV